MSTLVPFATVFMYCYNWFSIVTSALHPAPCDAALSDILFSSRSTPYFSVGNLSAGSPYLCTLTSPLSLPSPSPISWLLPESFPVLISHFGTFFFKYLFRFGIFFGIRSHYSTPLWISIRKIIVSPGLLPLLLILVLLFFFLL
jgi:hypothetical protein